MPKKVKTSTQIKSSSSSKSNTHGDQNKSTWGIILIIVGVLFLFGNWGLLDWLALDKIWPIAIVALGITIYIRNK